MARSFEAGSGRKRGRPDPFNYLFDPTRTMHEKLTRAQDTLRNDMSRIAKSKNVGMLLTIQRGLSEHVLDNLYKLFPSQQEYIKHLHAQAAEHMRDVAQRRSDKVALHPLVLYVDSEECNNGVLVYSPKDGKSFYIGTPSVHPGRLHCENGLEDCIKNKPFKESIWTRHIICLHVLGFNARFVVVKKREMSNVLAAAPDDASLPDAASVLGASEEMYDRCKQALEKNYIPTSTKSVQLPVDPPKTAEVGVERVHLREKWMNAMKERQARPPSPASPSGLKLTSIPGVQGRKPTSEEVWDFPKAVESVRKERTDKEKEEDERIDKVISFILSQDQKTQDQSMLENLDSVEEDDSWDWISDDDEESFAYERGLCRGASGNRGASGSQKDRSLPPVSGDDLCACEAAAEDFVASTAKLADGDDRCKSDGAAAKDFVASPAQLADGDDLCECDAAAAEDFVAREVELPMPIDTTTTATAVSTLKRAHDAKDVDSCEQKRVRRGERAVVGEFKAKGVKKKKERSLSMLALALGPGFKSRK